MADIEINRFTSKTIGCIIDYTREGFSPMAFVVGGNVKIETTIVMDVGSAPFTDNLALKDGWSGSANITEKTTDPTKTDVYSRFSTDPEEAKYDDLDYQGTEREYAGPYTYRGFTASTFLLDSGGEQVSATAMVEDAEDEWKFTGQIGLGSRLQDGAIPYLRIQAGDKELEYNNREKNKIVTLIIEGGARGWKVAVDTGIDYTGETEDQWFVPLTVTTTDRFKFYKAYKSFRTGPLTATSPTYPVTDDTLRDDSDALEAYALDYLQTTTIPGISGSIDMLGNSQFSIGDKIDNIITRNNGSTPVNLAIVDQSTQYAPPRSAGEAGQDTITIELGRK